MRNLVQIADVGFWVIRWVNVDLVSHMPLRHLWSSSKSTVRRHHRDISDTDVLWLLPAEEDNVCEFYRINESRIAKHLAVFLKADSHLLMNRRSDQSGCQVDYTNVVFSF